MIYNKPVVAGKVGGEYRYQVSANRSLGDLRMRSPEIANFWDVEKPQFALEQGPKWLKLDAATGMLTGTPDAPGKFEVTITSTIDRKVRKLDNAKLGWGQEAVVSQSTEHVGSSTQRFVIEVNP